MGISRLGDDAEALRGSRVSPLLTFACRQLEGSLAEQHSSLTLVEAS